MIKKVLVIALAIGFSVCTVLAMPSVKGLFKPSQQIEYVQVKVLPEAKITVKISDFAAPTVLESREYKVFIRTCAEKKNAQIKFIPQKEQNSIVVDVIFDQLKSQQASIKVFGFSEKMSPETITFVKKLLFEQSHALRNGLIFSSAAAALGLGFGYKLGYKDDIEYSVHQVLSTFRRAPGNCNKTLQAVFDEFKRLIKEKVDLTCFDYDLLCLFDDEQDQQLWKNFDGLSRKPIVSIAILSLKRLFAVDQDSELSFLKQPGLGQGTNLYNEPNIRRLFFVVADDQEGVSFAQQFKTAYDSCSAKYKDILARLFGYHILYEEPSVGQPYHTSPSATAPSCNLSEGLIFVGLGGVCKLIGPMSDMTRRFPKSIQNNKKLTWSNRFDPKFYLRTVESSLYGINLNQTCLNRYIRGSKGFSSENAHKILAGEVFNYLLTDYPTSSYWCINIDPGKSFLGASS
jgi:hypothetical protein